MIKRKNYNKLNKKEQATTAAYKLMREQINMLKKSLKKTQDESEKIRVENNELTKKNIILESNLKKQTVIEILKFLSSGGLGFALNFFAIGIIYLGLEIGIPSVIIYFICIYFQKK